MHILITGGTGLIGQRLTSSLLKQGMYPRLLSRKANHSGEVPRYQWSIKEGKLDPTALDGVDVVIHLAGAGVADERWTAKRQKEILDSRILSTRLLYDTINQLESKPSLLICASATGYYGIHDHQHISREEDSAGTDFLANVCVQWEAEADRFEALDMKVIKVRTGVVLDPEGGALQKIAQPIKYYAGAPLGSGKQQISWIHWEDWCRAVLHFLSKEAQSGVYNLVAPNPVTNAHLTRLIARAINKPIWLPNVPGFALKLMLGKMSSVVLEGHSISAKKLQQSGFQFKFETAEEAINELLGPD
ncbi:MAG: TIGR01777 family oxidoreductase [Reichenbachiella sp.]|uniref:TIGR01777 family oxidoreductase n=1 Tax=Reichenbachiella sp. TaxID=2184521 RepID=UPI00326572C3